MGKCMVGCVCAWDHGKGRDWREVTGSNRGVEGIEEMWPEETHGKRGGLN